MSKNSDVGESQCKNKKINNADYAQSLPGEPKSEQKLTAFAFFAFAAIPTEEFWAIVGVLVGIIVGPRDWLNIRYGFWIYLFAGVAILCLYLTTRFERFLVPPGTITGWTLKFLKRNRHCVATNRDAFFCYIGYCFLDNSRAALWFFIWKRDNVDFIKAN